MKSKKMMIFSLLLLSFLFLLSACTAGIKHEEENRSETPALNDYIDLTYPEGTAFFATLFEDGETYLPLPDGFYTPQGEGLITYFDNVLYYTGIQQRSIWAASAGGIANEMIKKADIAPNSTLSMLCKTDQAFYYYAENEGLYQLHEDGSSTPVFSGKVLEYCVFSDTLYLVTIEDGVYVLYQIPKEQSPTFVTKDSTSLSILGGSQETLYIAAGTQDYYSFHVVKNKLTPCKENNIRTALLSYQTEGFALLPLSEYRQGFELIVDSVSENNDADNTPNLVRRKNAKGYGNDAGYVLGTSIYVFPNYDEEKQLKSIFVYTFHDDKSVMDVMQFIVPEE